MSTPRLSASSYLVLGWISLLGKPTTYDISRHVSYSVGEFWPFPQSQLYAETSRLAEAGLLAAEREQGGRDRRHYSITDAGRRALYRSGCMRKYILAVTDGENTRGRSPDGVAREIHRRSEGGVTIYFVAFDTDPAKFGFLKKIGGDVLHARGRAHLERVLTEIYEGRILAEAVEGDVNSPR